MGQSIHPKNSVAPRCMTALKPFALLSIPNDNEQFLHLFTFHYAVFCHHQCSVIVIPSPSVAQLSQLHPRAEGRNSTDPPRLTHGQTTFGISDPFQSPRPIRVQRNGRVPSLSADPSILQTSPHPQANCITVPPALVFSIFSFSFPPSTWPAITTQSPPPSAPRVHMHLPISPLFFSSDSSRHSPSLASGNAMPSLTYVPRGR